MANPNPNPFLTLPPIPTYPDLRSKTILITGIGQVGTPSLPLWGNGAATACAFARQGCRIFGCDLSLDAAETTKRRIEEEMGRLGFNRKSVSVEVVECDVTREEAVREMVGRCVEVFGGVDVLINNVGLSMPGTAASMAPDVFAQQLNVNLTSVYNVCHHVLPLMEAQRSGAIVNIASIAALRYIGKPQIGYSASKAGVIQFTKVTAAMYADKGIRVNVVVPGLMHTPLVEVLAEKYNQGDYEGLVKKRNEAVPMGGMGSGWDTANCMLFLASGAARYVTGQEIVCDGGITGVTAPG